MLACVLPRSNALGPVLTLTPATAGPDTTGNKMKLKKHLLLGTLAVSMPLLAVTLALTGGTELAPASTGTLTPMVATSLSDGLTMTNGQLGGQRDAGGKPGGTNGRKLDRSSRPLPTASFVIDGLPATQATDVLTTAASIEHGQTLSVTPVDIDGTPAWRVEVKTEDGSIVVGHVDVLSGTVLGWETLKTGESPGRGGGHKAGTAGGQESLESADRQEREDD